ncbi:nuclease-related domain-containing protein, partial [Jeotgalibaca porci]|uniref:nuclease-related domain-containing protein n=1 Tax=Jeotgalibaca porci TaxID=1868793 RepID=UPI0035A059FF
MLLKSREKSFELVQFEALRGRILFSEEQERLYKYVTAGFTGESLCDQMAESMAGRVIQIRDLRLESGGRTCQVDSLLVLDGKVYLLQIKNWEGS